MGNLKVLALAIAVAGFATSAQAGHGGAGGGGGGNGCAQGAEQTGSVVSTTADFTLNFGVTCGASSSTFSGFDPNWGTLTAVDVTLTVNGSQIGLGSATSTLSVVDGGAPSAAPGALIQDLSPLLLAYSSDNETPSNSETVAITDPTGLSEFFGASYAFALALSTSTVGGTPSEDGSIGITYIYSAVPEPSALAVFAAGLMGLTFVRFRKRA